MADIRIIVGRAGSGKSSFCIKEIAEYINNRKDNINGAPAFLIVPEQLSVQAERRLLSEASLDGLLRDEVISFKRAAYRVLGNIGGLKHDLLTQSGKIMLLTQALKSVSGQLSFYTIHATKPRGMEAILELIEEFGRYGATAENLRMLSEKDETDAVLKSKLHDLSIIYTAYRALTADRYYDNETLYNDMICALPSDATFAGANVWIDGFGGFTSQEYGIIKGLFNTCASVTISVCTDRNGSKSFDNSNETCRALEELSNECGYGCRYITLDEKNKIPPRFIKNKYLAHLEKFYNTYPYEKISGSDTGIHILKCANLYYEVTECAKKIVELHNQGVKYSEIAVVSGDLSLYGKAAGAVFPSFNIPYFVDEKRGIDTHPLVRYILELLELVSSNWSYMAVFSFLKTGLYETNIRLVDKLENDVLARGIKGKNGKKGWKLYVGRIYDEPDYNKDIHDLAKRLFEDIEVFSSAIKNCKNVTECCFAIVDFLEQNDVNSKVSFFANSLRNKGLLDEADEYSRIWNIVIEVLDQANVFLGDITFDDARSKVAFFKDILSNGFGRYKAGFIPHSAECVQIGTPERSKSLNPKVLFILGANEDVFPKAIKDIGLLSDNDREYMLANGILLSDDNRKRVFYSDFVVYTVLSSASEQIYVSYSISSVDGASLIPSGVIRNILKLFPDMGTESVGIDGLPSSISDGFKGNTNLSEDAVTKLFNLCGDHTILSVSKIESYNKCPYSYLLNYGLKLEPRKEYAMEAVDKGNLMHAVFELASKVASEDEQGIKGLDRKKCEEIIETVFEKAVLQFNDEGDVFLGTERSAYTTSKMKRIAASELENLSKQLKFNMLQPNGFEIQYGFDNEESLPPVKIDCDGTFKVLLNGKVDRLDIGEIAEPRASSDEVQMSGEGVFNDYESAIYFRVIDYKSSAQKITVGDIVNGLKIQLITYISAVSKGLAQMPEYRDKKIIPAAAFYYAFGTDVKSLDKHFDGNLEKIKDEHYMDGLFLAKENIFSSLHGGVLKMKDNILVSACAVPVGGFDDLIESTNQAVRATVKNMKKGEFPVRPVVPSDKKSPCKYCAYGSVCRIQNDGVAMPENLESVSAEEYWSG